MSKKKNNIEIKIKPIIKHRVPHLPTRVHVPQTLRDPKYNNGIEIDDIDLEYEKVKREYNKKRLEKKYDKS